MATNPVRIRLSRATGFDLQAHSLATNGLPAINVARPGPWGNPFVVGRDGTRADCVDLHRKLLGGMICLSCAATVDAQHKARDHAAANLHLLRGKNLACWCALDGGPCHGDTLLVLANPRWEEFTP